MSSRKKYYEIIDRFIEDPHRKILLLKGEWGVGKSYLWKDYLGHKLNHLNYRAYSYVSLFGINSLNNIKSEIFSNAEILGKSNNFLNKFGITYTLSFFTKHIPCLKECKLFKKARRITKANSFFLQAPYVKNYHGLINQLESLYIKNFLICFDDIERKSKELALSTFLGLCDQLKEEKACKIIIILNEDEIKENGDSNELDKYREKIIDQELLFQPTLADNFSIVFNSDKYNDIYNLIETLALRNLRILYKIKWNLDFFDEYFCELQPSLKEYFHNLIVKLSYLILSPNISTEFNMLVAFKDKKPKDLDLERHAFFNKHGYYFDPKDRIFINYIRDMDQVDHEKLTLYIQAVRKREEESGITAKIAEIWDNYKANFSLSQEQWFAKVTNLLDEKLEYMSISNLEIILETLKKIDPDFDTGKYWGRYIELNLEQFSLEELETFKDRVTDPELLNLIVRKSEQMISCQSIREIVSYVTNVNSSNHNHTLRLLHATEDEYYEWFISETDPKFLRLLCDFLRTFSSTSENIEYRSIGTKVVNALNRIAKIDKLKELQVRELMGVKESE